MRGVVKMSIETTIKVKLFAVLGNVHQGPIDLTIYEFNKPESLTGPEAVEALQFPPGTVPHGQYSLYSKRMHQRLESHETFGEQGVTSGDILILTDSNDDQDVFSLAEVLSDQAGIAVESPNIPDTRARAVLRGLFKGIPYVGPALEAWILGPKKDS